MFLWFCFFVEFLNVMWIEKESRKEDFLEFLRERKGEESASVVYSSDAVLHGRHQFSNLVGRRGNRRHYFVNAARTFVGFRCRSLHGEAVSCFLGSPHGGLEFFERNLVPFLQGKAFDGRRLMIVALFVGGDEGIHKVVAHLVFDRLVAFHHVVVVVSKV